MSAKNPDFCEKCGTRPVFIYLCDGSAGTSRNLCEECLAQENSLASAWVKNSKSAKCEFCGGGPCGGGTDTLGQITGAPLRDQWMCFPCSMEHHSHILAEMNKIPEGLPQDQQIEVLKKISEETKVHMRRFVARSGN